MGLGKKVFIRKNGTQKGGRLYKWSPGAQDKKATKGVVDKQYFCTTPIGSQGNDFISTYSYVLVIVGGGIINRTAYVQCDYVK